LGGGQNNSNILIWTLVNSLPAQNGIACTRKSYLVTLDTVLGAPYTSERLDFRQGWFGVVVQRDGSYKIKTYDKFGAVVARGEEKKGLSPPQ